MPQEETMKLTTIASRTLLCALMVSASVIATVYSAESLDKERNRRTMDCELRFNLKGRPAFYETATGEGVITCNNGQMAELSIRASGGGITFGMSEVVDGTGKFSDAGTIDELFGSYVHGEVFARTGNPVAVQVLTKGRISLVLAGTGRGMDFGFAFEKLTLERANEATLSRHSLNKNSQKEAK
jgi:hypothetical protein